MTDLQANKRTALRRVILDTPALLNMVKHCRESQTFDVSTGILMGVTQREITETEDSLLITQTMPKANKAQMNDLLKTLEQESQKLMDTNEVGFYVNTRMGLGFNMEVLNSIIEATKKFKNSVFVVYDTSKSNNGLNPLRAYRLSEKAIFTFNKGGVLQLQSHLLQNQLSSEEIFDEIPIKVQRSHMQQAYLYDHIQPGMPAFNTNMFKLAQSTYLESHAFQAAEVADKFNHELTAKYENATKAYSKMKKGVTGTLSNKQLAMITKEDVRANRMDFLLLAQQVDTLCSQVSEFGFQDETAA